MKLQTVDGLFSVCRLNGLEGVTPTEDFVFFSRTDSELSLVCKSGSVPPGALEDGGWRLMRIAGTLDFSLVGILAGITSALADAGVPVFAVSTFDTDYFLVKDADFARAAAALSGAGYELI